MPSSDNDWQPIETAPRGVSVLACSPSYIEAVILKKYRYNGLDAWRNGDGDVHHPTVWMPLPPPPKEPGR